MPNRSTRLRCWMSTSRPEPIAFTRSRRSAADALFAFCFGCGGFWPGAFFGGSSPRGCFFAPRLFCAGCGFVARFLFWRALWPGFWPGFCRLPRAVPGSAIATRRRLAGGAAHWQTSQFLEFLQRLFQVIDDALNLGQRPAAGHDAEIQAVVVAHQRDIHGETIEDNRRGVDTIKSRAVPVQTFAWPRYIGDYRAVGGVPGRQAENRGYDGGQLCELHENRCFARGHVGE